MEGRRRLEGSILLLAWMGVIGGSNCRLGALLLLLLVQVLVMVTVLIKIVGRGLHKSTLLLLDLLSLLHLVLRLGLVFPIGLHMVHFPKRVLLVAGRIGLHRIRFEGLLFRVAQLLACLVVGGVRLRSVLVGHEFLHLRLPLILVGRDMSRHALLLHLCLISVNELRLLLLLVLNHLIRSSSSKLILLFLF